jgi:hypothetical protein
MEFIPFRSETFVSSLSKREVLGHLRRVTSEVNFLDQQTLDNQGILFYGIVGQRGFRISKAIQKLDTFLPLIFGEVEETNRGSIIFLKYKLFPGALFFLGFWTVILLGFSIYYLGGTSEFFFGGLSLFLAVANYLITWILFKRRLRATRDIFFKLMTFQLND